MKKLHVTAGALLAAALSWTATGSGQTAQAPASRPAEGPPGIKAIEVPDPGGQILSFRHLIGSTVVQMKGTKIEPGASTHLKVESRPGFLEIDINRGDIKGLQPARRFGKDFLTYVLWAVSVDGAAMNLGEITFEAGAPVSINVTTPYQTFWLMVTAEPDFAVHDPSPVVVLYSLNQDAVQTPIKALPVAGKLIYYTYYSRYDTSPAEVVRGVPNELLEARKAVELASQSGILAAPTPAGEEPLPDELRTRQTLEQARNYLQQAEKAFRTSGGALDAVQFARTAAQIAENARALALGAVGGLYVRQLDRELSKLRAEVEQLRQQVAEAGPLREEADRLRRALEEANARLADCQRELASLRDRFSQLEAALDLERRRTKELESQLLALQERLALLESELAAARQENARLREERDKICSELHRQLASLGQLQQQGGQLVLTLASDILFDFDRYDLRPAARENLARLAVVRLLLFRGAAVRYEGHTDLVGEQDYNQWLSEQRALAVYRYFLQDELGQAGNENQRASLQEQLGQVDELLKMAFAQARRQSAQRQQWLAPLEDTVVGKGMREPVVNEKGQNEKNRRVTLIFPEARAGELTTLCPAPASPSQ